MERKEEERKGMKKIQMCYAHVSALHNYYNQYVLEICTNKCFKLLKMHFSRYITIVVK